ASGSHNKPPPQPTSTMLRPSKGRIRLPSRPNCARRCSRMKPSRTGLNLWIGLNLPSGFHHSSAMAVNLLISASLTVVSVMGGSGSRAYDPRVAAEARRHERALAGGLLPSRRAADPGFASAAMSLAGATYGFVRGGYRLSGVPKWAAFGREWVMG